MFIRILSFLSKKKVIPHDLITVFEANEFEMILNGIPFINVED
jgi:hypothetical protein